MLLNGWQNDGLLDGSSIVVADKKPNLKEI